MPVCRHSHLDHHILILVDLLLHRIPLLVLHHSWHRETLERALARGAAAAAHRRPASCPAGVEVSCLREDGCGVWERKVPRGLTQHETDLPGGLALHGKSLSLLQKARRRKPVQGAGSCWDAPPHCCTLPPTAAQPHPSPFLLLEGCRGCGQACATAERGLGAPGALLNLCDRRVAQWATEIGTMGMSSGRFLLPHLCMGWSPLRAFSQCDPRSWLTCTQLDQLQEWRRAAIGEPPATAAALPPQTFLGASDRPCESDQTLQNARPALLVHPRGCRRHRQCRPPPPFAAPSG